MSKMRLTLVALLICFAWQTASAQSNDTTARIDKIFSSWNNATPGGSIIVARGITVLYHKAYGMADLERNVPNTTETIFEAGSVSKQFTAFSILLLEKEGKLSLKDDVRKYVPEVPVYESPITLQMLLNHTSGLKDWGSVGAISGWPRGTKVYTLDLALQIISRQKTTNFKPGAEYSYSNSNYSLLVAIVERVSKQSLEDFTEERIFEPLGMNNTRWRSNFREIIPGRAQAYSKSYDYYELQMPFENIYGHGGLLTTTGDLLKWNQLLEKHDAIFHERIKRGKLNNGSEITYAAGIQHGKVSDNDEIGHSGATAGYRAWLAYYPAKKLTIALLSNDGRSAPVELGRQVAYVFLGGKPGRSEPVDVLPREKAKNPYDPKEMGTYIGDYYSDEAQCTLKVAVMDGVLVVIDTALKDEMLEPITRDLFNLDGAIVEFKRNKKGVITGFNISVSRANNVPFIKTTK
jgi:CubicO group peptidase (beta-lactamase class C family)